MIRGHFYGASLIVLCACAMASAQESFPETHDLERVGLTGAWWGRAIVDPGQDEIEYLIPDEQHIIAQSRQGLLTIFRADTGRVEWSVLLGRPGKKAFPAVMNAESVIVTVGMNMYALDRFTGETLWYLKLPTHPSCAPEVDDDQVYFGAVDGSVYAYDLRKIRQLHSENKLPAYTFNAQVWRYKTPQDVISIVSDRGYVNFVSRIGSLYGVEPREGKLLYQVETNAIVEAPLGRGPDGVYVCSTDARMLALNLNNGRMRWAFTSGTTIVDRPRIIGNQVLVTPLNFGMFSLDADSGLEQWPQPQLRLRDFLAASNDKIYGTDSLGSLVIVDRRNGNITGTLPFRQFNVHAANDLTDRIYVATTTGLVACFREQSASLPTFHRNPERRPILPEMAPDAPAAESAAAAEEPAATETSN